jgi:hypothetical protein
LYIAEKEAKLTDSENMVNNINNNNSLIISLRKEIEELKSFKNEISKELKSYKNDNKKLYEENKNLGNSLATKKLNEKESKFFEEILLKIISIQQNIELKNKLINLIDLFDYINNIEYDKITLEKKMENFERELFDISNDNNNNNNFKNKEFENALINQINNMKNLILEFEEKINDKKKEMINLFNNLDKFNIALCNNNNNNKYEENKKKINEDFSENNNNNNKFNPYAYPYNNNNNINNINSLEFRENLPKESLECDIFSSNFLTTEKNINSFMISGDRHENNKNIYNNINNNNKDKENNDPDIDKDKDKQAHGSIFTFSQSEKANENENENENEIENENDLNNNNNNNKETGRSYLNELQIQRKNKKKNINENMNNNLNNPTQEILNNNDNNKRYENLNNLNNSNLYKNNNNINNNIHNNNNINNIKRANFNRK